MSSSFSYVRLVDYFGVDEAYHQLVANVLANGQPVSPRGKPNLELRGCLVVTTKHARLRGCGVNYRLATAEAMAWLAGWDDVAWLERFRPGFGQFSDDGVTLHGAYGRRLNLSGSLATAVERLKKDPESRQAVVNIWDSVEDSEPSKDLPCNIALHLMLRNRGLELHVHVRSQDLIWGFPYDHDAWWQVGKVLARCIHPDLPMGALYQYVDSLHIYGEGAGFYDGAKVMRCAASRPCRDGDVQPLELPDLLSGGNLDLASVRSRLRQVRELVEGGQKDEDKLVTYLQKQTEETK